MRHIVFSLLTLLALASASLPTSQAAEFEIFQSSYQPLKLAWLVDGSNASASDIQSIGDIVRHDLESSRSFVMLNPFSYLADIKQFKKGVDYADWRIIGTDILAVAHLKQLGNHWNADIEVHDPFRNKLLSKTSLSYTSRSLRLLAHHIANHIYRAATGIPGYFDSHILYVSKHGQRADLIYQDQDGANRQTVGRNFRLLLSPDLSPDSTLVALNTYVGNHPRLETFNLTTGKRRTFGDFQGLNSTPAWSPDGRYIAATLSYTGNSEIHLFDTKTRKWRQLTHHKGIDTSPTWSPDGEYIAFTSNRSGSPQIFKMKLSSGHVERITHSGPYNTSPEWSPAGERIAFIALKNWQYALTTMRADGSDMRYLVTGGQVDTPAWSPNAQMLLFSRMVQGSRQVYRVPSWGGKIEAISRKNEDASDPVWSR
ncbi:MAG: Tol-Pal system beta propeller repeat protein TolB [Mariprofundaceae bacterium]|nr:Tol-Pal system beta propeller repeat protein TolB [Mariprofundaceae bacterium]